MFEVHQPVRIKLGKRRVEGLEEFKKEWFDWDLSKEVIERASRKCYEPANSIILEEIQRAKDEGERFKVSFSLSGILIEQLKMFRPEIIESFRQLVKTGDVELLCQTYYHSLSSLFKDPNEFKEQVEMHRKLIKREFGYEPVTFENTEFIYDDAIGDVIAKLGFKAILTEGAERILGWRSPTYLYKTKSGLRLLMRHYKLSDDIGFRFSNRSWNQWPLTADKYADWLSKLQGQFVLLAMDYETFGEHHWPETGIYEFLRYLPRKVLKRGLKFATPKEIAEKIEPVDVIEVSPSSTLSWADIDKGIGAWAGNIMQRTALEEVEGIGKIVRTKEEKEIWRLFQISDHFHYMFTGMGGPMEVHGYFSPFKDPVLAFVTYTRGLLAFLRLLLTKRSKKRR